MWNINDYIIQPDQTQIFSLFEADLNLVYFVFGRDAQKNK